VTVAALFDLSGRTALITGGSRGIGRSIALAFAEAGANVIIASRNAEACESVAREAREFGVEAVAHACHVGHWREVNELAQTAHERVDQLDILVNNAGMSPRYPSPDAVSEELFDKVIGVNLKGPFRLTALVGARMAQGRGGSIINVSSIGGTRPSGEVIPYAAAKAGLNAITIGFADALGPSVRVNCLMPGPILTDIAKAWDMRAFTARAEGFPLRRGGRPDELAGAALYLASDASSYTTGAMLAVDGGAMWATSRARVGASAVGDSR
jgi:NAD(P)-dependent dehydrogenase (short-subunit alcohol dehydrogenase family)